MTTNGFGQRWVVGAFAVCSAGGRGAGMMKRAFARVLLAVVAAAAVMLPQAVQAIDAPNWVAALHVAGQKAIGLRWAPVPGATNYKVLRSTAAGAGHAEIGSVAAPQLFDKDIEPGTTYYYVLQSVGAGEVSALSQERSVAIPGEKKKEAVAAPVLKDATLSQSTEFGKTVSKVGVSWGPVAGAIAYNIYRSDVKGKDYQMLSSSSEMAYIDASVEIGKTYYYAVSALDGSFQETPHSEEKSVAVTEPEIKAVKVRKEKIKIKLRATRVLFEIKEGEWGKLVQPSSIAVAPNGDLYIPDTAQSKVFVFNSKAEFLFAFGEGEMTNPNDIAISDEGDVLIVDAGKALLLYDTEGKQRKTIDYDSLMPNVKLKNRKISRVEAGSGGRWYLTNSWDMQVFVVDEDFEPLETLGSAGEELNQFRGPVGVVEDRKNGLIAVADTFNFQVKVWKGSEAIVGFGSYGNSVGQFSRLVDVAVTDTGDILALDFLNATAQAFDAEGTFLYVLGVQTMDGQVQFGTPSAIAVRGKTVYVSQTLAGKFVALELLDEIGPPVKKKK